LISWGRTTLTILHNIAYHAEFVEIASSSLGAERLLEGDLNVADRVLIPCGAHGDVGETEHKKILYHLLAEIMVDTEGFILCPVLLDCAEEFTSGIQVFAERFLDDNAVDPRFSVVAVLFQVFGDRNEDSGWESEVEEAINLFGLIRRLESFHMFPELVKGGTIFIISSNVGKNGLERFDGICDVFVIFCVLDVGCCTPFKICLV
jgi:hypothetical protein